MPQDLIRKECTIREIKLNTRTNKADRIKCLRRYDELVNRGEDPTSASTMASGNTRRTKHCMFRLANVVLSKDMVTRLAEITAYKENDEEYSGLIADDVEFVEITPGTIVPHNAAKLEELWKELTSFFSISEANFRLSGTHDQKFKKFTHGKADVLYLWYWTKARPEALSCVRGGMYEEDEFD
ncbi:hypothetical protein GN958_ATG04342 [Phytophthora infestans]|uniref:Uncharacterized protein n=1 Tax=Phytophthora infestans TaxID=4787 RepID=A0A8S9V325_PHYIN|nr:hypothetical protein GN958_ATG04342 [Phytophthora infestans]